MVAIVTRTEHPLDWIIRVHKEQGWILFMPGDGICDFCHKDIVPSIANSTKWRTGNAEQVTGCPLCHMSYCE